MIFIKEDMKIIRHGLILCLMTGLHFLVVAHPFHPDPVLEKLNEYLMALQIIRNEDVQAQEIFREWEELRKASWKIRKLTDSENLPIAEPSVQKQIKETKTKRERLLTLCEKYFSRLAKEAPSIEIVLGDSLEVKWESPVFEIPVWRQRVLLIEVRNTRNNAAHVKMNCDPSDEILFWNKSFNLRAGERRFTYAVIAPLDEQMKKNIIRVSDSSGHEGRAVIHALGIAPGEAPFELQPGPTVYKVGLPAENETRKPTAENKKFLNKAIRFRINDKETGNLLPVRVHVTDESGDTYWSPITGSSYAVKRDSIGWFTPLWQFQPGPFFYINGVADLGVDPVGKTAHIYHGFEYRPVKLKIPEDGIVDIAMERWIDMPGRGWYNGQTHIHTTDAGIPVQFTKFWPLVSRAEDLHLSAILSLKGEWQTHAIYANEYPMGKREHFSTPDHIITYGEEYRSNPYGHLALIGLNTLIQPISSGALGELGGPDYPPNSFVLDEALEQGATTIGAHFGNYILSGESIKTPWPSTGFEMPVDVALGKIQLAEVYGTGGQRDVWYKLLNCGFKLPATAGPDWVMKDSPRVYVHLGDKPFDIDNWREGLAQGRSFITRGPMLFFEVKDQLPGSEIDLSKGSAKVSIKAKALIADRQLPVEIIVNGEVAARGIDLDTTLTIHDTGWIAARCEGAHSNPVFVNFEGRTGGYAAPAKEFIAVIDRLMSWVESKGLYDTDAQKQAVLEVLNQGKQVYRQIIESATKLGRSQ